MLLTKPLLASLAAPSAPAARRFWRPAMLGMVLALSFVQGCGAQRSTAAALGSASGDITSAYSSYTALPLAVRTNLTAAMGSLSFSQLGKALGEPSIEALAPRYATIDVYLKSLGAKPTQLSAQDFGKALQGKTAVKLRAEVALNLSVMLVLNHLSAASSGTSPATKTGLSLAAADCTSLPTTLRSAVSDWAASSQPDSAHQYSYDAQGRQFIHMVKPPSRLNKAGMLYTQKSDDFAEAQTVSIRGAPDQVTAVTGSITTATSTQALSTCQIKQIKGFVEAAVIQNMDNQAIAHLAAMSWGQAGSVD